MFENVHYKTDTESKFGSNIYTNNDLKSDLQAGRLSC
jgi:hypothetical protein